MRIRINLFQFVAIFLSVATLCESAKASLRIIPIRFFLKISGIRRYDESYTSAPFIFELSG